MWRRAGADTPVDVELVELAKDELLSGRDSSEFAATLGRLSSAGEAGANEERALFLLAEGGGRNPASRDHVSLYGFTNHSMITPALDRLRRRGLVERRRREWVIVDPPFEAWLLRSSPFAAGAD